MNEPPAASTPHRYAPQHLLPPYSYVPGMFPHPISDRAGHSYGGMRDVGGDAFLYAVDLFNHGYYWEAHETWESLWHACGRRGADADFFKGLIKLAAAGVKAREGNAHGVRRHAKRAGELLRSVADKEQRLGCSVEALVRMADEIDREAEAYLCPSPEKVVCVFPTAIEVLSSKR